MNKLSDKFEEIFELIFQPLITLSNLLSIQTLISVVINFPFKNKLKIVAGHGAFCACSSVSSLIIFNGSFLF